jgi:hypothetical protein
MTALGIPFEMLKTAALASPGWTIMYWEASKDSVSGNVISLTTVISWATTKLGAAQVNKNIQKKEESKTRGLYLKIGPEAEFLPCLREAGFKCSIKG